tara:strand:+ start:1376 stop:2338 length:963 start_codon:yes stop_codon:yes gene_type:complete
MAIILLCLAEIIVRLHFQENMSGRFEYGFHPTAGFIEKGDRLYLKRTGGRRFRPQNMSLVPKKGVNRIFVIGDSVVRGSSIESSYARKIAHLLKKNGIEVESYNLGVGGHGARRTHLTLLKSLSYKPDLIIFHINNSNEYEDEREYRRSQQFKSWHPRNWPMKSFALRRIYEIKTERFLWRWIPSSIRLQHAKNDADAEIEASLSPQTRAVWDEQVRKSTLKSVQAVLDNSIPILLISQARIKDRANSDWTLTDNGLDELAAGLAKNNGVFHLSMKSIFKDHDAESLYSDSSHLTPNGHTLIAEAIANSIITQRLAIQNR